MHKADADKANEALTQAEAAVIQAKVAYDRAQKSVEANIDTHFQADIDRAEAVQAEAKATYDQTKAAYDQASIACDRAKASVYEQARAKAVLEILAKVEKDRFQWEPTITEIYFRKLQSYAATTITDADGKFSVKIPRSGRFAVFATTERMVGDKTEHYRWLVWASLDGQDSKTILLSNHNQINTSNPDCIALPPPPTFTAPPIQPKI